MTEVTYRKLATVIGRFRRSGKVTDRLRPKVAGQIACRAISTAAFAPELHHSGSTGHTVQLGCVPLKLLRVNRPLDLAPSGLDIKYFRVQQQMSVFCFVLQHFLCGQGTAP